MVAHACNPSYSGGWGRRIAWTQEAEVAVSRDRAIALQPGQQERDSISKKREVTTITFTLHMRRDTGTLYNLPWIPSLIFSLSLSTHILLFLFIYFFSVGYPALNGTARGLSRSIQLWLILSACKRGGVVHTGDLPLVPRSNSVSCWSLQLAGNLFTVILKFELWAL